MCRILLAAFLVLFAAPAGAATAAPSAASSQRFDATALADAVLQALPESGQKITVRLDNPRLVVDAPAAALLSVQDMAVEPSGRRFTAQARVEEDGRVLATVPLAGRLVTTVSLPILTHAMRPGDLISAGDVDWQETEVVPGVEQYLTRAEDIINKTPRRPVRAGVPLRGFDLAPPVLVKRGSQVAMIYENGRLHITTQGRALGDGAIGDTIRVVNLSSSRTVEGRVEPSGAVRVGPGGTNG